MKTVRLFAFLLLLVPFLPLGCGSRSAPAEQKSNAAVESQPADQKGNAADEGQQDKPKLPPNRKPKAR